MLNYEEIDNLITRALFKHAKKYRTNARRRPQREPVKEFPQKRTANGDTRPHETYWDDWRQEAHIAAIKAQRTFDSSRGTLERRYLYVAVRNAVLDQIREIRKQQKRAKVVSLDDPEVRVPECRSEAPDDAADRETFWDLVAEVLTHPVRLLILVLRYLGDWKSTEIAALLAVRLQNPRWNAARVDREAYIARQRLRGSAPLQRFAASVGVLSAA